MTPNDLLLRHAHLIVKSLLQRLDKAYKRFLKFSNTSLAAEISTSRHWSAVRGMEQSHEKTCLEGGIGYQRVRIDENYPIKLMLNEAEAHGEPVETLHVVNDDDTHTLIWRDGRLIE